MGRTFPATTRLIAFCALLTCILVPLAGAADGPAPAFQVRAGDTGATARTLTWLQARPAGQQPPKVWVYFTDKNVFDSATCADRLAALRETIAEPARTRRANVLGEALVDFLDLPVHPAYVDAVTGCGAEVVRRSRWLNAVSVRASADVLARVAALPCVHKLAPVAASRRSYPEPGASTPPTDKRTLFIYGPSHDQLAEINVIAAHDLGYSGAGVIVCMLDTGFFKDHDAFAGIIGSGRLLAEWDFINDDGDVQGDPGELFVDDHGTATWSALGGFDEGELIGPAHGASFLLGKTEDYYGEYPAEEDNWVAGAEWADQHGAHVISSSLGYTDWYTWEDLDGNTGVTTIAADIAASRGIVVCNAAGNEGTHDWYYVIVPADADSIITVGATDADNQVAAFSSHGPTWDGRTKPEVCARGVGTACAILIPEIPPVPAYGEQTGTSMATPLVAGCAALVIEAHPDWNPMQVREALMMTADNAHAPDNHRGWGRIDVMAAIDYVISAADDPVVGPAAGLVQAAPNPFGSSTTIRYRLPRDAGSGRAEIYDVKGRRVRTLELATGGNAFTWRGRDTAGFPVAAGIYLVHVQAGDWRATTKVVVRR